MRDEFLRSQGTLNRAIMFVTHNLGEVPRLADRIAIMKDWVPLIQIVPHQLKELKMKLLILLILR